MAMGIAQLKREEGIGGRKVPGRGGSLSTTERSRNLLFGGKNRSA